MQNTLTLKKGNGTAMRVTNWLIKYTPLIASLLLFVLFAYAAYNKATIYPTFVKQLIKTPLIHYLPAGMQNISAYVLASLVLLTETALAVLLLLKRTRPLALWGSFFLMLLFTAYAYVVPHFFHSTLSCSCGGIISKFSWRGHFYMNLSFTILTAIAVSLLPLTQKQNTNT